MHLYFIIILLKYITLTGVEAPMKYPQLCPHKLPKIVMPTKQPILNQSNKLPVR